MNSAFQCGRHDLAKKLLDASPGDVAKHMSMIRSCATEGNLSGAKRVCESLKTSGLEMNSIIHNAVLDACVECKDLPAAEKWMEEMKAAGVADVVSFNTIMKAYLVSNMFDKARDLVEQMKLEGIVTSPRKRLRWTILWIR